MSPRHELEYLNDYWRLVALATGLGTIRCDAQRAFVHLDATAHSHFGIPLHSSLGLPVDAWLALMAPEDQLRVRALLHSPIRPDEAQSATVHVPIASAQPKVLELSFCCAPTKDLIGACRDVTREHSQETLRRQKLEADRANEAKSEFMSHVSHELRTPLNAILGFAELMLLDPSAPLQPVQHERLVVLQQSGQRLLGLIDQLLQIGRIEQGKSGLRRKSVHLLPLVQRCITLLEVQAAQRGIQIEIDADLVGAGMSVRADPNALEQVITNLLSNAIKYNCDHGRVRLRLRSGEDAELTFEDTGAGITDSQLGHLFEPFNRLGADKTRVQGTGLGLVITRKLVQAMGGRLEVWSKLGKGSRFEVHLPLGSRVRVMRDTHTLPLDLPSRWDSGQHHSVLYVEDDEVSVVLLTQLFATQPDWTLECARTGAAGIAAAVRLRPQLIVVDMNLPDMSGVELIRRLKADPRTSDLPCVAVSADALPDSIRSALSKGFDDYWTKPLELSSVIEKIKRLLRPERE